MNLEELQAEAEALSPEDRNRLFRFTLFLNMTPERRAEERAFLLEEIAGLKGQNGKALERATNRLRDLDEAEEYARTGAARP